jgi:hypothetical protein
VGKKNKNQNAISIQIFIINANVLYTFLYNYFDNLYNFVIYFEGNPLTPTQIPPKTSSAFLPLPPEKLSFT